MATLTAISVYPFKSARGVTVAQAPLGDRGLVHDRRWMAVDAAGRFLSQRTHPQLALVEIEILGPGIVLRRPGAELLELPAVERGPRRDVEIWGDRCKAIDLGQRAGDWFADLLGQACHVVYMPDSALREVDPAYGRAGEHVGFADGFPYLLISQGSLEALNRRLERPVPMNRFRPNLVVDGVAPFAEDSWQRVRIGDAVFRIAKPCARCVTATVDQSTGEGSTEPLKTLAAFRKREGKVYFGQNLVAESGERVRVGDPVHPEG